MGSRAGAIAGRLCVEGLWAWVSGKPRHPEPFYTTPVTDLRDSSVAGYEREVPLPLLLLSSPDCHGLTCAPMVSGQGSGT